MKRKILKTLFYIKNFELIRHILWLKKRKHIFSLRGNVSNEEYLTLLYKNTFGHEPNISNPQTYNEKLLWLKLYWRNPLCYSLCDKYKVREYVKKCGCDELLLPLIAKYDSPSEINLDDLPNSFVMKTTHDSGGIFICKNKDDNKSVEKGIQKITSHFSKKHSNTFLEWVYEKVQPRIIVEPIIKTQKNRQPKDYKFFCFNGEPKYFFISSDRDINCKFDFFDIEGNWIKVINGHPHSKKAPKLPDNFEEMINYCKKLSKGFPQVRVDLYNENGKILFGELTFFHHAGDEKFKPSSFDLVLGKELDLTLIPKNELIK